MIKKLLLTFLIVPSLLSPGLAQDSPELVEATQLSRQVVKLYNEKKYYEALPLAKRALELRQKALAREHPLLPLKIAFEAHRLSSLASPLT